MSSLLLLKIFCWFSIGIFAYKKSVTYKQFVDSKSGTELFVYLLPVMFLIHLVMAYISIVMNNYLPSINNNILTESIFNFSDTTAGGSTETTSSGGSVQNPTTATVQTSTQTEALPQKSSDHFTSNPGAAAIVTSAAIAGGTQLAKYSPTIAGKVAVVVGTGALATSMFVANHHVTKMKSDSKNMGNNLISDFNLDSVLNSSGNTGLDLLNTIQFFNEIEVYLILSTFYILFCLKVNPNKVEIILSKFLPLFIVNYYIKILLIVKNIAVYLLI